MQIKYKFPYLYELLILIASVSLALFTCIQSIIVLAPGIDSSWAYGISYTFQNHLLMGKDIIFTFGPLGFLEHTVPLTASMARISSLFWLISSVISIFLILVLCCESAQKKWHVIINISLAAILVIYCNDPIQRLLLIAYTCTFLHWRTQKVFYLFLVSATAIVCLMIKFSYGVTVLALYLPYLAVVALREKSFKISVAGALVIPTLYLLSWYFLQGTFSGSLMYLKGGLEFSRGSTSAMAMNPDNRWLSIVEFYTAFLCGTFIISKNYRQGWLAMPLIFLGPLFIWSKYAFGREDSGHLVYLMYFVFYLGILWMIATETLFQKISCLFIVLIFFFTWKDFSLKAGGVSDFKLHPEFSTLHTFASQWHPEAFIKMAENETEKLSTSLRLNPELLETIGSSSVDIYPWETMITYTNKLNWKPRPIFQSYITYTPFLDQKNLTFYESAQAPEFIIWHYHSYQDIDNRYPLSTDPLTLQAILQHYQLNRCKDGFCLWQHVQHNQLQITNSQLSTHASWNSWLDVPTSLHADVIRAHINVDRTLLGKLNMALWKEGDVEIDYRLKNGDIKTHTLVLDNAISGLWASPYMADRVSEKEPEAISQQQLKTLLAAKPAEGYIEKAESGIDGLRVVGWGLLPFEPTQTQQLSLLFYNDKQAYLFKVQNHTRPGITEYFKKVGIVDLETSGINELVNSRHMIPGRYRVSFAVKNAGESAAHIQSPAVMLDVEERTLESSHNVQAIRIRTSRPWAFAETFMLNWSGMTFVEKAPW